MLDTDPQANATLGLGVYPDSVGRNIYHYYMARCREAPKEVLLSDYIIRTVSGIDLIPSHLDLVGAEPVLYQNAERYHILATGLQPLKPKYDFILIDTPPFLGQFLLNGIIAADRSILVFSPDTFALSGYNHLTTIIQDISELLDVKVTIGMAILNRWGVKPGDKEEMNILERIYSLFGIKSQEITETQDEIKLQLEQRVGVEIPEVVIVHEGRDVARSIQRGIPLVTLSPGDPALPGFTKAAHIIESWR